MTAPFILRRKKADVLKELPDKLEENRISAMEGEQRRLYDAQVVHMKQMLENAWQEFLTQANDAGYDIGEESASGWLKDLFGDFGNEGLTRPVLRAHVNDDAMAWLSLDCSISRIFGNPKAKEVLSGTIQKMRSRITPFAPEMTFEDMMQALGKMTLRELLVERGIDTDRLDEMNEALGKIPNI